MPEVAGRARLDLSTGIRVHLLQVYSNSFAKESNLVSKLLVAIRKEKPRTDLEKTDRPGRALRMREEEIDRLVVHYKKVRNIRTVAREFHVSRDTVAKHLASRGIDTSRTMKPAEIKRAKELYAQGMGSGRIGRILGFDNKTVLKALK